LAVATKKIRRRRAAGELAVEQTRDLAQVARMLSAAGMLTAGVESSGGCYLMAYVGDEVAGVVGIEVRVDAALIRSLMVMDAMRRRGIGTALVTAARIAAHTRGARTLYAIAFDDHSARYFVRFGFAPAASEELLQALAGTFMADYLRQHPNETERLRAFSLDISSDGVIHR
jgi:N-acetylglutamate synthase-like GNAT family acetyltransferase